MSFTPVSIDLYINTHGLPWEHKHLIYGQNDQNTGEDPQLLPLGEDDQQKSFCPFHVQVVLLILQNKGD